MTNEDKIMDKFNEIFPDVRRLKVNPTPTDTQTEGEDEDEDEYDYHMNMVGSEEE